MNLHYHWNSINFKKNILVKYHIYNKGIISSDVFRIPHVNLKWGTKELNAHPSLVLEQPISILFVDCLWCGAAIDCASRGRQVGASCGHATPPSPASLEPGSAQTRTPRRFHAAPCQILPSPPSPPPNWALSLKTRSCFVKWVISLSI